MTISKICGLCTLGAFLFTIALGVGWETRDYELEHKPRAERMFAWMEYKDCLDACRADQLAVCAKIDVPPDLCPIECSRCDVYKEEK